jgi:hypothetical protein
MTRPALTPLQLRIDRLLSAGINPLAICGRLRIDGETFRAEIQTIEHLNTHRLPTNDLSRLLIRLAVYQGWSSNKIASLLSNVPPETYQRAEDIAFDWLIKHLDFPMPIREAQTRE